MSTADAPTENSQGLSSVCAVIVTTDATNKTAQKFADRLGRTEGRLSRLQNLLGGNG